MKQKWTFQLFFLIAITGSVFLSYSCGCEEDSKTDPLGKPEIAMSLQDLRLTEGEETTDSTLTLSLTPASTEDMTVSFTISGEDITREDFTLTAGSAISEDIFADDNTLSGILIIEMGSANASLTLTVSDDDLDERAEETLRFTLNDSDSYSVNPSARAVEVVLIDKKTEIDLSLQDPRLTEGGETTNSTLTLSLTSAPTEDLTVSFTISGEGITREDFTLTAGSAISEDIFADDNTLSGILIIEMGSTNASLTLTVLDDALDERAEETLRLTLNDSDSYSVNPSAGAVEVVLIDKKTEIALSLQDPRLTEGGETTNSTLTLSLIPAPTEDLTVSFTISGEGITREDFTLTAGSAISEDIFADDNTLSGILIIEMGSANASLTLTVLDDALDERAEETLRLTLNDSDSYSVNPSAGAVEVVLIDKKTEIALSLQDDRFETD